MNGIGEVAFVVTGLLCANVVAVDWLLGALYKCRLESSAQPASNGSTEFEDLSELSR